MSFYLKDPRARVDYAIDWAVQLQGRTLAASAWTVFPAELDGVAVENDSFGAATSRARIEGGRIGAIYSVVNQVTFSDGGAETRVITLRVEEK